MDAESSTARDGGRREQRRAQTMAEIKAIALRQLEHGGAHALSLRAIAREIGVSVQALYHYFPSRESLVTELVTDTFDQLADVVAAAGGRRPSTSSAAERPSVAAGLAYRRWAVEHRSAFLLVFGTPLPGYGAPPEGPTSAAAAALGDAFVTAVFAGWTREELERIPAPAPSPARRRAAPAPGPLLDAAAERELPTGALAAFTTGWALLYGHVMLELLGHAPWLGDRGEDALEAALVGHAKALDAARA
ncbi:MAG: TetR/AcrR family transcriptional regulator [Dermatophilaceae bacterium]